ncbi:MAG: ABC transporter permease [Clostridia bacterium]|nr:ABC transporter permease [Clostridia bacterium]
MNKEGRTPLIQLSKRKLLPWYVTLGIRLGAIVLALIVCAIITTVTTGLSPLAVYKTMWEGAFGTSRKAWMVGQELAMLLGVALALTPAFRMKFWNLGGEGQVLIGCLASATCMILLGEKLPNAALIPIMTVCSIGAGAIWALIPAIFKAKWNTNETLFTLMMNYIATQLVAYYVIIWETPKGSGKIGIINQATNAGWMPQIGEYKYLLNILIIAAVTVAMHIYLKYSKHGYEISVVGESVSTARYVGIKVDRVILRTLLLSGAICGLIGLLLVSSTNHTLTTSLAGGRGFTAVLVAWLAKFDPIAMVFSSLLIVFLSRGASEISTAYMLNQAFGDILTGIILFFIIGSEFFINYQIRFRRKEDQLDDEARAKLAEMQTSEKGVH